jgi:DNA-nicking Smr family endonuclease
MPQKSITVPKELHGKVIGKGWATKKDIEDDYKVHLTFPAKDDPLACDIIIEGPTNESIGFAEARIRDICGLNNGANGSNENNIDQIRDQVRELKREKDELYRLAHAAPQGRERDRLFNEANQAKARCEQADLEAGNKIFAIKNQGYGDEQMDLHGLTVEEAERFVNQRLDKVKSRLQNNNTGFVLEIITGIGNHSTNHVAKIKPAIMDLLRDRGFQYSLDETGGIINVTGVVGSGGGQTGAKRESTQQPQSAADDFTHFIESIFDAIACCFGGSSSRQNK